MNANQEDLHNKIVDDLAAQGYSVVDGFLTNEQVDTILALDEFRDGLTHLKKAGIGKQTDFRINEGIRGDYIRWIDRTKAAAPILQYVQSMDELMQFINRTLFLSLKDMELHMTVYPPGGYYKRHLDQFGPADHRKLSAICYLNKNWDDSLGGQLKMFLSGKEETILPVAGRFVIFRSDTIEHEVMPSLRERMSITGWMLDQQADLRHL